MSDARCTPREVIEFARDVMGFIDLDPTSNAVAQTWIEARSFYTIEDDCLEHRWHAQNVWMNPPYSGPGPFISKLLAEYALNSVREALVLVKGDPSTKWWKQLSPYPRMWWPKRLKFTDENGKPLGTAPFPVAMFYLPKKPLIHLSTSRFFSAAKMIGAEYALPGPMLSALHARLKAHGREWADDALFELAMLT